MVVWVTYFSGLTQCIEYSADGSARDRIYISSRRMGDTMYAHRDGVSGIDLLAAYSALGQVAPHSGDLEIPSRQEQRAARVWIGYNGTFGQTYT